MKFSDILATASTNMFRSKLRTTLTVVAIFIGAFTLTLTNGLGAGISTYIDKQLGNLGAEDTIFIMAKESSDFLSGAPKKYDPQKKTVSIESEGNRTVTVLTSQDITKIKAISGIKSAEPYQSASVDYITTSGADKYTASINPHITGANYTLDAGRPVDNDATVNQIIIPSTYTASLAFNSASNAIGKTVSLGVTNALGAQSEITATIVAVEQKSLVGGTSLIANTTLTKALRAAQYAGLPGSATDSFQMAMARFDPALSSQDIAKLKLRLDQAGYTGQTIQDQIGAFKAVITGIVAVLDGFAVIALLAASFGIINTLLMSVQERTREIGLMKAMGMGSGRIFILFSLEAVMLGFWGSALGSLFAISIGILINRTVLSTFLKDLVGLQLLSFSPASVAVIIGLVMTIAFLAGTLPAIRAARHNPIDSLRYE